MSDLDPLYYDDRFRLVFQHKLRFWQMVVGTLLRTYVLMAAMHFLCNLIFIRPNLADLTAVDALIFILAVVDTAIWIRVFRDPHRFLHFHRPSSGYRWAVCGVSAASTIPAFVLHIQKTIIGSRIKSQSFAPTVVILLLFICISIVNLWMVRRFLLGESDERYEPTVPFLRTVAVHAPSSKSQSVSAVAALEPYSDSLPSSSSYESRLSSNGHLSKAYAVQEESDALSIFGPEGGFHGQSPGPIETEHTPKPKDDSTLNLSEPIASESADNGQPTSPPRCRTVARFDYMCQDRIGPHSWLSYLLIPLTLGIWNTMIFAFISVIVYENYFVKYPSHDPRCGLLAPLGGYLCCAYALKRRLRKSLFSRSHIALPAPWIETRSLVGRPVFVDSDTGASTHVDPRLRAFPVDGQNRTVGLRSSEYIKAYNAHPSTCKEYWGHLGRAWSTRSRRTPTLSVIFFLWFGVILVVRGIICLARYSDNMDRDARLSSFTPPDLKRIYRIMGLLGYSSTHEILFGTILCIYVIYCTLSSLLLWRSIRRTGLRKVT